MKREQMLYVLNNPKNATPQTLHDACFMAAQLLLEQPEHKAEEVALEGIAPAQILSPPSMQAVQRMLEAEERAQVARTALIQRFVAVEAFAGSQERRSEALWQWLCALMQQLDVPGWVDEHGHKLEDNRDFVLVRDAMREVVARTMPEAVVPDGK